MHACRRVVTGLAPDGRSTVISDGPAPNALSVPFWPGLALTSLWVTNSARAQFLSDPGSNYWAVIRAGTSATGFPAIDMLISGGKGPTNVLISHNTISNWIGHAIGLTGDQNIIEVQRLPQSTRH